MLQLQNGCSCSEPSVFPNNWMTGCKALLKINWYIQYYFKDPQFKDQYKYGKLIIIKRMNTFKTLEERRAAVNMLLENELSLLKDYEYNPITGNRVLPIEDILVQYDIDPTTPFIKALEQALKRITVESATKMDMKSVIKYVEIAAIRFRYDKLQIAEVKRKHIKILLEEQERIKLVDKEGKFSARKWTTARYNVYRKHLHRLFEELIELEACEYNPVSKISKKSVVNKMRLTMTKEQRHDAINVYLKKNFYTFYRFCNIFFHSGGREAELLRLQVKDVVITRQRY